MNDKEWKVGQRVQIKEGETSKEFREAYGIPRLDKSAAGVIQQAWSNGNTAIVQFDGPWQIGYIDGCSLLVDVNDLEEEDI